MSARAAILLPALIVCLLACAPPVRGESDVFDRVSRLAGHPGLPEHPTRAWPRAVPRVPGAVTPPPLLERLVDDPVHAAYHVGMIEFAVRDALASPSSLTLIAAQLGGTPLWRSPTSPGGMGLQQGLEPDLEPDNPADPLAHALQALSAAAGKAAHEEVHPAPLPHVQLRATLAGLLHAIAQVEGFRQRAFAQLPATLTADTLVRQAVHGQVEAFETPDFRTVLGQIDTAALAVGLFDLSVAAERLQHFLRNTPTLPALQWQIDTALGRVIIDTTPTDNLHTVDNVLILIDTRGDDEYRFTTASHTQGIQLIFDATGNDRYEGTDHATGPATAVLGYAVLWDAQGDDVYDTADHSLSQAAALFGGALLIDEAGNDVFKARSHAQGWALGGTAVLLDLHGNDQRHALAHAQGAAGPGGVALLIEAGGDDQYTLAPHPLHFPSAQLPDRNVSMGQGAAMGLRASFTDGRSLPGGLGALIDLAGNDVYVAGVFAQGAGYFQGVGALIDADGCDQFEAAWYAMGAAAHSAAGALIKRGTGNDEYRATHSTALGAAHDLSIALFIDEGGDDRYHLGTLGFGAAHDNSQALFIDTLGSDRYQLDASECRAFGAAPMSSWGDARELMPSLGLFFDLGGTDHYPDTCPSTANDSAWAWPRQHPTLNLRSERGAGIDGEYANPFFTLPLTR